MQFFIEIYHRRESLSGQENHNKRFAISHAFAKELTKSVHGTNRNNTMNNWFTSIKLADEVLSDPYKMIILGTLRTNKREILSELLAITNRKPNTSMFCFDQ